MDVLEINDIEVLEIDVKDCNDKFASSSLLNDPSGIRTHVSRVSRVKNQCLKPTKLQLPIHIVDCCWN